MLILHDYELSANCYAARLLAGLLGLHVEIRRVDVYPGRENEGAAFLALSPLGTVPVLETDELVLRDWQAILVHLAMLSDDAARWWPARDPRLVAWLGFARELEASAGLARLHDGIGLDVDITQCRARAHQLLRVLERHLWFVEQEGAQWLLPGPHACVADIAVFVHVALCEEGGIARMDYPALRRWIDRVRRLPSFVVISGVFEAPAL